LITTLLSINYITRGWKWKKYSQIGGNFP
jgi:hypothetical protein